MKKFLAVVIVVILVAVSASAGDVSVSESYKYKRITTATDTVVKAAAGNFAGLTVSGGTMGAITLYDNTTCAGVVIDNITSPYNNLIWPGGFKFTTGLCVTTAEATAILVVYE